MVIHVYVLRLQKSIFNPFRGLSSLRCLQVRWYKRCRDPRRGQNWAFASPAGQGEGRRGCDIPSTCTSIFTMLCMWANRAGMRMFSPHPEKHCWALTYCFPPPSSYVALSKLCHKSSGFYLNSPPASDMLYLWIMLPPSELQGAQQ